MGLARSLWHEFSEDSVTDLAAGLAYRALFALFPFVIFLGALTAFVAPAAGVEDPNAWVIENVSTAIPEESQSAVTSELTSILAEQRPGLLSFGLIAALWAASSGMSATMRALNRVYDIRDRRPFWKKIAVAIGLTVGVGGLVLAAMVLAIAGNAITPFLTDTLGIDGGAATALGVAVDLARIVVAVVLMAAAVGVLYWAGPDAGLPFRWLTWGATMFVVTWLVAAVAFGWYVSNFGNYNATYGALGGLIIAMLWFYISAIALLIGAELNAIMVRRNDPASARELDQASDEGREGATGRDERTPSVRDHERAGSGRQGHREAPVPPTPVSPAAVGARPDESTPNGRHTADRSQRDEDGRTPERAGALDALVGAVTLWRATGPASSSGARDSAPGNGETESTQSSAAGSSPTGPIRVHQMDGGER